MDAKEVEFTVFFAGSFTRFSERDKIYSEEFTCGGHLWRLFVNKKITSCGLFIEILDLEQNKNEMVEFQCDLFVVNQLFPEKSISLDFVFTMTNYVADRGYGTVLTSDSYSEFLKDDTLFVNVSLTVSRSSSPVISRFNSEKPKGPTHLLGLVNQGCTCYINAFLQSMYHLRSFRSAIFSIADVEESQREKSISWQLQRLFYQLQTGTIAPHTRDLTKSFGWGLEESNKQQDIQEFSRILQDKLEELLNGSSNFIKNFFVGKIESFIKCTNIEFESKKEEQFYDLPLNVKGFATLEKSIDDFLAVEFLNGSNQYRSTEFGLQDAEKGVRFVSLPAILQLQLKRFEYDPYLDQMVKIHDCFEFAVILDLQKYFPANVFNERYLYKLYSVLVHSGDVGGGHYSAFVCNAQNQWFKLDDEIVTFASEMEAVEANFGRINFKDDNSSAYMLTYIRVSDFEQILTAEIVNPPMSIIECSQMFEKCCKEEDLMRKKKNRTINVDVLLEKKLIGTYSGIDFPLSYSNNDHSLFKLEVDKMNSLTDLLPRISELNGCQVQNFNIWLLAYTNQRKGFRPIFCVPFEELDTKFGPKDDTISEVCYDHKFWAPELKRCLFVSFSPGQFEFFFSRPNYRSRCIIILIKLFNPASQTIQYAGSVLFDLTIFESLRCPSFKELISRITAPTSFLHKFSARSFRVFIESNPCFEIDINEKLNSVLICGDIIILSEIFSEYDHNLCKEKWNHSLSGLQKPNLSKHISPISSLKLPAAYFKTPFDLLTEVHNTSTFQLFLKKEIIDLNSYFFIDLNTEKDFKDIANCLDHPAVQLRLFAMVNNHFIPNKFITLDCSKNEPLSKFIGDSRCLAYELLDFRVDMLRTHQQCTVRYVVGTFEGINVTPLCPLDADMECVGENVLGLLLSEGRVLEEGEMCFFLVTHHQIESAISLNSKAADLWNWDKGFSNLNVDIVMQMLPLVTEFTRRIFCHYSYSGTQMDVLDVRQNVGDPFCVIINNNDTLHDLRLHLASTCVESFDVVRRQWRLFALNDNSKNCIELFNDEIILNSVRIEGFDFNRIRIQKPHSQRASVDSGVKFIDSKQDV